MARQNSTTDSTESNTEAPKAPEAPAEGTEAPQGEAAVSDQPTAPDLTKFTEAVKAALKTADDTTGTLPAEQVALVNEQYRALDGLKAKNAARDYLDEKMIEAVVALDAPTARGYSDLKAGLSAGKTAATKVSADPLAAYVARESAVRLALSLLESEAPEGAADKVTETVGNLVEEAKAYQAWTKSEAEDKGEAPELSAITKSAFKILGGKAAGSGRTSTGAGGTGVRRSIGKHIAEAFAGQDAGDFLTIAEIAKFKSDEYGDSHPSQGAVSARIFPDSGTCTVEGIEPVEANTVDGKNPKGARKVA